MTTFAALMAAEHFESWLSETQTWFEQHATAQQKQMAKGHAMGSYEEAYSAWLSSGGFEQIACNYGLAVETLLVILSVPESERPIDIPTVDTNEDGHNWETMTEIGFQVALYKWHHGDSQPDKRPD